MKALLAFAAGAILAAGAVFLFVTKDQSVESPAISQAPVEESAPAAETASAVEEVVPEPTSQSVPAVQKPEPEAVRKPKPAVKTAESQVKQPKPETVAKPAAPKPAPPQPVKTEPPPPAELPPPPQVETAAAIPAPPPPPEPNKVTLEAGSLLTVRLAENLTTERNVTGDLFEATLDEPLVVDGFVIAEKGASLEGRVVTSQKPGRVKGPAILSIQLIRLRTSDGQNVLISTDTFEKEVTAQRKKEATKVGAAAAIGAAIGAIAGGGKGAAIGAAVGGGAGAGSVLATRSDPAELAVETRLSFRLSEPVTITEKVQ